MKKELVSERETEGEEGSREREREGERLTKVCERK